jgi:hypothetical protein
MYVWSKRLVIGILVGFALAAGLFAVRGEGPESRFWITWIILNYIGLMLWIFVWMIDQTRVRGKNLWVWLLPFLVAPLPTLMALVLFLQRKVKA